MGIGIVALAIVGIGFSVRGVVANNKYESGGVSEEEENLYNIAKADKEARESKEDVIEAKSEVIAENTDENADEIKEKMTSDYKRRQALVKAAKENGFQVTSEEIDAVLEKTKKLIHEDEDVEKQFQAVLSGSDMTEEEYWKKVRPQYEEGMLADKYLDSEVEKRLKMSEEDMKLLDNTDKVNDCKEKIMQEVEKNMKKTKFRNT